jgi:general secretion pathway protein D
MDIPVLGNLFSSNSINNQRTELLVLLTPRVVRDQEEAREVTQELRRRLRGIGNLEERIGGQYDEPRSGTPAQPTGTDEN